MGTVIMPASLTKAVAELDGIGALLQAKEWHRAAILATFVRLPGSGGPPNRKGTVCTADEFAARGIKGLESDKTVRLYVQRWLDANDDEYPEPGKRVKLPETAWPPSRTGTDGFESEDGAERTLAKIAEKNPTAFARAIRQPAVAAVVAADRQANAAVIDAGVERIKANSGGSGRGGPLGPTLDALEKLLQQLGAKGFSWSGEVLYNALLQRAHDSLPWRPGELEAVMHEIDVGLRFGTDAKALLTPVSDEDLASLLAGGKEG